MRKSELSRDFVDFCIHRLRVRSKDDGLVNLGAYEGSFSYIVWSALCRLMRRNPIALIEKNNPHHRFVSRTLGKIVDFVGEKRAHGELWDVLSPGPDHELLRAELASFLPDWQQRLAELTNYGGSESEVHYPADAGDAVQRSSDYRLISIVNNLHRYWPVAVDFRLRNFFRRIRGRGHYSPPIHDSARSATLWLRDVRYRFLTRNLARLDRVFRPPHPTQDHNQ